MEYSLELFQTEDQEAFLQARISKHPDIKSLLTRGWKLGDISYYVYPDELQVEVSVVVMNADTSRVMRYRIEGSWINHSWLRELWRLNDATS